MRSTERNIQSNVSSLRVFCLRCAVLQGFCPNPHVNDLTMLPYLYILCALLTYPLDGPIMEFLKPFNEPWKESLSQGLHVTEIPLYIAVKKFFQRPYFCNNWILSELAFATIPVFLVGDLFMNWLQMLRYVFITEELLEKGSIYYPEENRHLLNHFPLGSLYFFLEEYDRRRQAQLGMERREIKGQTVNENGDTQVEPVIEDSRSRRRQSNY